MGLLLWTLTALCIIIVVYKLLDRVLRRQRIGNYSDRYILVTGCDSGFGHDLVRRLDSLGCHVFAGCFTEAGETRLKKICSERVTTITLDVTNHDSVQKAFRVVTRKLQADGKGLWGVLNNAGAMTTMGPLEWVSVDDYRRNCDVNLFGLIDVTLTFLPLVKKSRGRVVNTSSISGVITLPMFASYSVSKYGVESFTDALRRFLKPIGCKAIIIEPCGFVTQMTSGLPAIYERTWNRCSPELRQEYSTQYANIKYRYFDKPKSSFVTSDFSPVVDAYEHALLARYPRPRYLMGPGSVLLKTLSVLPEYLSDRLLPID